LIATVDSIAKAEQGLKMRKSWKMNPWCGRRRMLAGLALAAIAVTGCTAGGGGGGIDAANPLAPPAPPAPKTLTIEISASNDINPNASGAPSPLPMQIYVLRSLGRFQTLDYFELKNNGAAALSGDLIDSSNVSLRPGETKTVTMTTGADGAYLGVAAGYREIDSARWRAQASIGEATSFAIRAGRSSVSVAGR
jgi:type VI secretion system protein VasD